MAVHYIRNITSSDFSEVREDAWLKMPVPVLTSWAPRSSSRWTLTRQPDMIFQCCLIQGENRAAFGIGRRTHARRLQQSKGERQRNCRRQRLYDPSLSRLSSVICFAHLCSAVQRCSWKWDLSSAWNVKVLSVHYETVVGRRSPGIWNWKHCFQYLQRCRIKMLYIKSPGCQDNHP